MDVRPIPLAVFPLGRIVATPNALSVLSAEDIGTALRRHQAGDWGNLSEDDRQANNQALANGARILSSYRSAGEVRFWIMTEADRSATTILLPQDY